MKKINISKEILEDLYINQKLSFLKKAYETLKEIILEPTGIKLLAVYMPINKEKWLAIINGVEQ